MMTAISSAGMKAPSRAWMLSRAPIVIRMPPRNSKPTWTIPGQVRPGVFFRRHSLMAMPIRTR